MFSIEHNLLKGSDVSLDGIFIAKVVSNADPKAQERVYVRVIGVHDMTNEDPEYGIWAMHCAPSKSNSGEVPDVDDYIYVMFPDKSNPNLCLWFGWVRYSEG